MTARSAVSREGTQATKHDLLRNLLQEQSLGQMFLQALCAAPAVASSPKFVNLSELYRRGRPKGWSSVLPPARPAARTRRPKLLGCRQFGPGCCPPASEAATLSFAFSRAFSRASDCGFLDKKAQTGAQKGAQKTHNCFLKVEHKKSTNSQTPPQKKHKLPNSYETPGRPPLKVDDKKHKLEHKKEHKKRTTVF